jgi:hypothetical protein
MRLLLPVRARRLSMRVPSAGEKLHFVHNVARRGSHLFYAAHPRFGSGAMSQPVMTERPPTRICDRSSRPPWGIGKARARVNAPELARRDETSARVECRLGSERDEPALPLLRDYAAGQLEPSSRAMSSAARWSAVPGTQLPPLECRLVRNWRTSPMLRRQLVPVPQRCASATERVRQRRLRASDRLQRSTSWTSSSWRRTSCSCRSTCWSSSSWRPWRSPLYVSNAMPLYAAAARHYDDACS